MCGGRRGPAGMMLGLLLARAGVQVTVLEKHDDFFRDFRGDTVHASTIRLIDELGLGEEFRRLPQSRLSNVAFPVPGGPPVTMGNFDSLPPPYNYVAMMPQWDFLNFLADAAAQDPSFSLRMGHKATLAGPQRRPRHSGSATATADGAGRKRSGPTSRSRRTGAIPPCAAAAGLAPKEYPVPSTPGGSGCPALASERGEIAGIVPAFGRGEALLALNRTDYFQMGTSRRRAPTPGSAPRALKVSDDGSRRSAPISPTAWTRSRRWRICTGWTCAWTACATGTSTGCSASGTPPMRCPRRAGSGSPGHRGRRGRRGGTLPRAAPGPGLPRRPCEMERRRRTPTVVVQTVQRVMHRPAVRTDYDRDACRGAGDPCCSWRGISRLSARSLPRFVAFGPRPEHAPAFARRAPQRQ